MDRIAHITDQHQSYAKELMQNILSDFAHYSEFNKSQIIEVYKIAAIEMVAEALHHGEIDISEQLDSIAGELFNNGKE